MTQETMGLKCPPNLRSGPYNGEKRLALLDIPIWQSCQTSPYPRIHQYLVLVAAAPELSRQASIPRTSARLPDVYRVGPLTPLLTKSRIRAPGLTTFQAQGLAFRWGCWWGPWRKGAVNQEVDGLSQAESDSGCPLQADSEHHSN